MQAPGLFDVADKRGKYGLVHNIGLGGAVVCSLLRRPEVYAEGGEDGRKRCGRSPLILSLSLSRWGWQRYERQKRRRRLSWRRR